MKSSNVGGKSVVLSFRSDRRLETIISDSGLPLYELVEKGLLSLAKSSASSKNDKLVEAAIDICENQIAYYSGCLKELNALKDAPKPEPAPAPIKREIADIAVTGHSGKGYWITRTIYDQFQGIFHLTEDGDPDWPLLNSVDEIPNEELNVEV